MLSLSSLYSGINTTDVIFRSYYTVWLTFVVDHRNGTIIGSLSVKSSGVYFFSLDASNPIAVAIARLFFHLPYFNTMMRSKRVDGYIHYYSYRTHSGYPSTEFQAIYRPIAPIAFAQHGSLEQWLTERYCLYTVVSGKGVYRGDIHHVPWPLQRAELETKKDTMASSYGIHLPETPPLLHYSHQQEVLIWPLKHVL